MDNLSKLYKLLPDNIRLLFVSLPNHILAQITDVRIRQNKPLIIYINKMPYFFSNSKLINHYSDKCFVVDERDFEIIVSNACNNSFHSNVNTMKQGFVTTKEGLRIGIASTAIYKNSELYSIKDITSLAVRIPHLHNNCSLKILSEIYSNPFPSVIIASLPSGGKTTLIRDISAKLSGGYRECYKKIAMIDERNEISNGFDVGINVDVIKAFDKKTGIEIATRTLSPDIIICDEIGNIEEVNAIKYGFSTGVNFIVTVHAYSFDDLINRNVVRSLIETREFKYIVILKNYTDEYEIYKISEELIENCRKYSDSAVFHLDRLENSQI